MNCVCSTLYIICMYGIVCECKYGCIWVIHTAIDTDIDIDMCIYIHFSEANFLDAWSYFCNAHST